jgi:radical SAM protein with 4Fe4S-binding SPASM domain
MILEQDQATEANLRAELDDIARRLNLSSVEDSLYFPRYVQIETIRICNARCAFCAVDQWDKTVPRMADALFDKIVEELKDYADWVRWVNIQRAGEPLLDRSIHDRIRKVKDAGIKAVTMSTNASALTERNARRLLDAGLDELMISIDSVDRETYERTRVGLNYDRVMANIRNFFALRDALRPSTRIRIRGIIFLPPSDPGFPAAVSAWEDYWKDLRAPGDRIYMLPPHTWGNQVGWDGYSPSVEATYHPCIMLWSSLQITAMGKVALCTDDYDAKIELGDVNRQGLAEIWRGEAFQRVRRIHASGRRNDLGMCLGCRTYDEPNSLEKEKFQPFASSEQPPPQPRRAEP